MAPNIVLYDLPTQRAGAWSLNPWKTRMVLNFKNVDYTTEWVEYPDLATRLNALGVPPNDTEASGIMTEYSSPAIRYPDGSFQMDSWPIAHALELRYPTPSLHLDDPVVVQVRDMIERLRKPITAHVMPKVPLILPKRSADYFYETRAVRFGMPLPQLEKEKAKEQDWVEAKEVAKEAGDLLKKNEGPYFLGETVSYADLIFVSFLHFLRQVNEDIFQRYLELDPTFPRVYDACKQWLERDT